MHSNRDNPDFVESIETNDGDSPGLESCGAKFA